MGLKAPPPSLTKSRRTNSRSARRIIPSAIPNRHSLPRSTARCDRTRRAAAAAWSGRSARTRRAKSPMDSFAVTSQSFAKKLRPLLVRYSRRRNGAGAVTVSNLAHQQQLRHRPASHDGWSRLGVTAVRTAHARFGIDLAATRSGRTRAMSSVSQYSSYREILPSLKWITKA